jgi:hypothetical protein
LGHRANLANGPDRRDRHHAAQVQGLN